MKDSLDIALEPNRWIILNHLKRGPDGRTFAWLKETMSLSDGNLFSHLRALKQYRLIKVEKKFKDKKPLTIYRLSLQGQDIIPKVLAFITDASFDDLDKALIKEVSQDVW